MSLRDEEQSYIDDLNALGDWMLQYEYLLEISRDLPHIPPEKRTEENRVHGCQSGVWLDLRTEDGLVRVLADSDALIIRGMISIIVYLLDERTPQEIMAWEPRFITATHIREQISTDRFNGLRSVIRTIQDYAARQASGGSGESGEVPHGTEG